MIPHLKIKIKLCSPHVCTIAKFIVLKHLVMIRCYKLYVHIQRVQASFAHAEILGFDLTSQACTDMASEHMNQKVKHESYE
jgi:hypothetical protein